MKPNYKRTQKSTKELFVNSCLSSFLSFQIDISDFCVSFVSFCGRVFYFGNVEIVNKFNTSTFELRKNVISFVELFVLISSLKPEEKWVGTILYQAKKTANLRWYLQPVETRKLLCLLR